ncbi:MAG: UPF0058 family protein [Candidatus Nanohaloarchaea archaeon]
MASLRKQESIHLHELGVLVDQYLEERAGDYDPDLSLYEDLEVSPHHIHREKAEHLNAFQALFPCIASGLGKDVYDSELLRNVEDYLDIEEEERITRDTEEDRRETARLIADGEKEDEDIRELGERLLEGHEEELEQEKDPIETRYVGEEVEEEEDREEAEYYEGW